MSATLTPLSLPCEPVGVPPTPPEGSPKSRSQLLDTAAALRAYWTEQGVPQDKQDELIAAIAAKAAPGAQVGPFSVAQEV